MLSSLNKQGHLEKRNEEVVLKHQSQECGGEKTLKSPNKLEKESLKEYRKNECVVSHLY